MGAAISAAATLALLTACGSNAEREDDLPPNALSLDIDRVANQAMDAANEMEAKAAKLGDRAKEAWRERTKAGGATPRNAGEADDEAEGSEGDGSEGDGAEE